MTTAFFQQNDLLYNEAIAYINAENWGGFYDEQHRLHDGSGGFSIQRIFQENVPREIWDAEMFCWWTACQSNSETPDGPIYDEVAGELRYLSALTEEEWEGARADLAEHPDWSCEFGTHLPLDTTEVEPVEIHAEDDDLGHLLNPFAD